VIDKSFLYAGRASYVVRNPQGESVTVKLSKSKEKLNPRTGQPWPTTFYVNLRHQNDAWQYVGALRVDSAKIIPTPKAQTFNQKAIAVAEWSLKIIRESLALPAGYSIDHTGRCGKCYKLLRDPESIALGLGPICRG
jgi:hypothetical protein